MIKWSCSRLSDTHFDKKKISVLQEHYSKDISCHTLVTRLGLAPKRRETIIRKLNTGLAIMVEWNFFFFFFPSICCHYWVKVVQKLRPKAKKCFTKDENKPKRNLAYFPDYKWVGPLIRQKAMEDLHLVQPWMNLIQIQIPPEKQCQNKTIERNAIWCKYWSITRISQIILLKSW